jgi:hypothetical protein
VTKTGASDEQDQRRLLLSVNHKGTILTVNTGTAGLSMKLLHLTTPGGTSSKAGDGKGYSNALHAKAHTRL